MPSDYENVPDDVLQSRLVRAERLAESAALNVDPGVYRSEANAMREELASRGLGYVVMEHGSFSDEG